MINISQLSRSFLFVPGDRPERFQKACSSGCDVVIIDLEDAVAKQNKEKARDEVIKYLLNRDLEKNNIFIRINSIKTFQGIKDIIAFIENNSFPDGLVLPMVDSDEEVKFVENILKEFNSELPLFAVIETPKGLTNVDKIASSSKNLKMIGFGSADYSSQTGSSLSWNALIQGRSQIINAAGMSGILAIDGVWPDINDEQGLIAETRKIVDMGFKGKMAIHPKQILGIHEAFLPDLEQVNFAKDVINAYESNKGGVISVRGKMIDEPLVVSARRILDIVDASK